MIIQPYWVDLKYIIGQKLDHINLPILLRYQKPQDRQLLPFRKEDAILLLLRLILMAQKVDIATKWIPLLGHQKSQQECLLQTIKDNYD